MNTIERNTYGELGVARSSDDLGVDGCKLICAVAECDDLRRAHECEVKRVEEQHYVFPSELAERNLGESLVRHERSRGKFRCRLLDLGERHGEYLESDWKFCYETLNCVDYTSFVATHTLCLTD